jgi:hypothetical protein
MATIHPFVMLKTSRMTGTHVSYRVKEELRRWNTHLEKHKKKINGARTTIEKNRKAVEMKERLQRSSHYQSEQRALGIQHDNELLLKKLNAVGCRDETLSRNVKYYDKRKSQNGSPSDVMKSVREKEKKNIKDEKSRMESKIRSAEQMKHRSKQEHKKDPSSGGSSASTKEDVESIRPNVLPVTLEKERKKNSNISSSRQVKRQKSKQADPKGKKNVQETKKKRSSKNNETIAKKNDDSTQEDDDIDREIDQIIVHSTYNENEEDNFQIDVVDGDSTSKDEDEVASQDVDDVINSFLNDVENDEAQVSGKSEPSSPIPPIVIPTADIVDEEETTTDRMSTPTNVTNRSETANTDHELPKKDRKRKESSGSSTSEASSHHDKNSDSDSD